MRHRAKAGLGRGTSLSLSRHPRREKIAPLKKLKKTLLDAEVLIDVSKIRIYAKENFDLELINNVNDRFVEKTYKLLMDTRKNMIPEDELNDFIFLLMNERKEKKSQVEKMRRNGQDKSDSVRGSAKCPIKNEVTNLIKKMNKFHFYFKEFLKKDKLWMDATDGGDGKATTWGTTRGTTLDNRGGQKQSDLQPNGDNACRKADTCFSYIGRKGETGKGESLYSQSKQKKEQREKTERAIRNLLSSGLSETESDVERPVQIDEMTQMAEEMNDSLGGRECATNKMALFRQRVKVKNVSPSSSDGKEIRETEDTQPYRCHYVQRGGGTPRGDSPHGCTFQRGCTNLVAGRSTNNRGSHRQGGDSQLVGIRHGDSLGDNSSDSNSDSSSGDDGRPSEVMRRSRSDGAKYCLYRNALSEDHHTGLAHGASLTEYERYIILRKKKKRKKKKKKKKNNNKDKDKGNQNSDSLTFLKVPNVLTCDWKKERGKDNRRKEPERNNVDNYLGDAYNSCEHPGERNPMLAASYKEAFSRGYLHEGRSNLVHTLLGTKDEKTEFSRKSGYAKGNTKGNAQRYIKGHPDGGAREREVEDTSTTGKKGLTPPSLTTSSLVIIPEENYSKKGMLIKSGNNSSPQGEKRSDQLCPHDGEGKLSELHKRGRDDIHLKVPNGPWPLAGSHKGNGVINVSGGGNPLPSETPTSGCSNGSRMRRRGTSKGFHADGGIAKVNNNVLEPLSGEVPTREDEVDKADRNVDRKTNASIEKGRRGNARLRHPLCEKSYSRTKDSADESPIVGGTRGQYDETAAHFDEQLTLDGPKEWNSDISTEEGINPLEESSRGNRDYMCSVLDLRYRPQDDSPTVTAKDPNEWEIFEGKESTPLHHKEEVDPSASVRKEEKSHVRNKNVKRYEQTISDCTSTMEYPSERHIYANRDVSSSVSKNGANFYSNREKRIVSPDCASTLGRDNADSYDYSDERFEDMDQDKRDTRSHYRGEEKYDFLAEDTWKGPNDVGMNQNGRDKTWRRNQDSIRGTHLGGDKKDTLQKRITGFLSKGAMKEGGGSNYFKSPTYDRALMRRVESDIAFYEDISHDMEGVTRGLQNGSFYGPSHRYLHGPDCPPDYSPHGDSPISFNPKDFLLLKKKREEDSRLNKWLNKMNSRENEKKKKIQKKKNESIKKELLDCTFHPRVSIVQPNKVKSFIKEEGTQGGGVNIHKRGGIELRPHNEKGQFDDDLHVASRGADRRAPRVKAITQVGSEWTDIAYHKSAIPPMNRYEDALMRDDVVGPMSRNISGGHSHGRGAAGGAARRGYHTRGRYTDGEIVPEEDIQSDDRNSNRRSSGEEPYRESKIKHRDRNELLYWKAMKQKEHLQRKKDAFEEAKENKFKSECKFSPEIKNNVTIYMSDLPKGYSKTVERIKRGVEEKRRVHNFLEYRIPVDTNGDKNAQNDLRSRWKGGKTTTLSPFSFDKGFYKVKIKPVYFETKIRLSENKIVSLAIREDEDPLYIVDIFCKIHAIRDEDKRVLYEYVMDELRKASHSR
ncbi:hypothetical protein C922_02439 [Plasmodium inui San Antonio 1]|uniref:Uncharacterized protein n=1 Tax=Plasmodium inui San Antonio 1 TaxID=1237626 RepID=W7ADX7_9APIC|nr:hypothetical protein C922_02439 [Plasmodium inui San Antonio 1]EUD67289.1 hypothetical protein C922_02439 [Plasmodium inui San Antonio 1]